MSRMSTAPRILAGHRGSAGAAHQRGLLRLFAVQARTRRVHAVGPRLPPCAPSAWMISPALPHPHKPTRLRRGCCPDLDPVPIPVPGLGQFSQALLGHFCLALKLKPNTVHSTENSRGLLDRIGTASLSVLYDMTSHLNDAVSHLSQSNLVLHRRNSRTQAGL
jgi:hypothetical protein